MSKTEQPDVVFEQFEQAGPDIRMLASQVKKVQDSDARNTLLRAIRVLLGKSTDPTEDEEQD